MTTIIRDIINPVLAILPPQMTSDEARAMLIAIGLQESGLHARKQVRGPAHGLWQFERIGVTEVLRNQKSREAALDLCWRCGVAPTTAAVYHRVDDDDILAAGIARLALWRHPHALPQRGQVWKAWGQYIYIWRPGKPHRKTWAAFFEQAWAIVDES